MYVKAKKEREHVVIFKTDLTASFVTFDLTAAALLASLAYNKLIGCRQRCVLLLMNTGHMHMSYNKLASWFQFNIRCSRKLRLLGL